MPPIVLKLCLGIVLRWFLVRFKLLDTCQVSVNLLYLVVFIRLLTRSQARLTIMSYQRYATALEGGLLIPHSVFPFSVASLPVIPHEPFTCG